MLPLLIFTFCVAVFNPVPVHPLNVYPALIGLFNVISSVVIWYLFGFVFPSSNFPPAKSYVIVYVFVVHFAYKVTFSLGK